MPADLSIVQEMDVECAACAAPFRFVRPVLPDLQARPDLRRRIEDGTLHATLCPRCASPCRFDGPALLLNREAAPHFVFVCVSHFARKNEYDLGTLFSALRQGHPGAMLDRWTKGKVLSVEHRFLPYLPRPWVQPGPGEWVAPLQLHLLVFLQVDKASRDEVALAVNLFPDLISPAAGEALDRLAALAARRGDEKTAAAARTSRSLLDLIRIVNT